MCVCVCVCVCVFSCLMVAREQEALAQQLMNKNHVIFETSDPNRTLAPGGAPAGAQREQCSVCLFLLLLPPPPAPHSTATPMKILGPTASNSRRARSHPAIAFILHAPCLAVERRLGLWKEGLSCLSSLTACHVCAPGKRAESYNLHPRAPHRFANKTLFSSVHASLRRKTGVDERRKRSAFVSASSALACSCAGCMRVAVALTRFWSRGDPWTCSRVVPNKLYTPAALGSDMCMMSETEEESFFICDCSRSTTRSAFIRAIMLLTLALSAGFLARLVGIPCASAHFMSFCCFVKAPRRGCAFRGPLMKGRERLVLSASSVRGAPAVCTATSANPAPTMHRSARLPSMETWASRVFVQATVGMVQDFNGRVGVEVGVLCAGCVGSL